MTCIIGLKCDGDVYIGGDSLASDSNGFCSTYKDPKVFYKRDFVFGYSGSYRVGQIIQYDFDIPIHPHELSDMGYLVGVFIPALQLKLEERKATHNSDQGLEAADNSSLLIAYKKEIYCLHSDFQLENNVDNIVSIGCGSTIALGCMYALEDMSPINRINKSLEIVSKLNIGVKGPFTVLKADYCFESRID